MSETFAPWSLDKIVPGEPLPAALYLHLEGRYVLYRAAGQSVDRLTFDRMEIKNIRTLYVLEQDKSKFDTWSASFALRAADPVSNVRAEARRSVKDIFHSFQSDENFTKVLETSSSLVDEVAKLPLAVQSLANLQSLSKDSADHSVNVSILSVYLALNLGYSHMVILKHLAAGALLHDIGKIEAFKVDEKDSEKYESVLRDHAALGEALLAKDDSISREVRMIVAQHHEFHDGTGHPKGLKGDQIYDLARIVAIANMFDGLVARGKGPLAERQKHALAELEGPLAGKFHPIKLKKIIKILSLGI